MKLEIFTSVITTGFIIFMCLGLFVVFLVYLYNKRQKTFRVEKELLQSQHQQSLLQTQIEIQEQTLLHISQEIHDNIGQVLSLAKLNLATFPALEDEQLQLKIGDTKQLVSKAIVDLRDLSRSMHGDRIAAIGLHQAIEDELKFIHNSKQFFTHFTTAGEPFKLDAQKEMVLFRMIQETLNNSIKHAKANTIEIVLEYHFPKLTITVADDGIGFDPTTLSQQQKGIGLGSMQQRAALIGAHQELLSSPGKGTSVIFTIHSTPLKN